MVQRIQPERDVLYDAVDEEGRRRTNVAAAAALDVLTHPLEVDVIVHLGGIARQIQSQVHSITIQILVLEMRLVLEQEIVHGPEFALRRRGLRGLGRQQRGRMRFLGREAPKYETNFVGKSLEQQLRRRRRDLAAGT